MLSLLKVDKMGEVNDYGKVQDHLLSGRQDLAYQVAVSIGAWPIALILARMTSEEMYTNTVSIVVKNSSTVYPSSGNISQYPAIGIFLGICSKMNIYEIIESVSSKEQGIQIPDFVKHWSAVLGVILANRTPDDVQFLHHFSDILLNYGMAHSSALRY
jgi:hypothetical protein